MRLKWLRLPSLVVLVHGSSAADGGVYLLGHVPGEPVKVHDFQPGQDCHVDQGHQDLQRGDEVGIWEVVI